MNKFTLYRADCRMNKINATYKTMCEISSFEDLSKAVLFDHVSCEYKNGHRAKDDFISANVVKMDLDNDHSDCPEDWKTLDDVIEAFPDVEFYYVFSKSHMIPKRTPKGEIKEPRPKYHFYFPCGMIRDPAEYERLKRQIGALFPYFDRRCADIAHFFYGVPKAEGGEINDD